VPLERLAGATLYSSAEPCAMCTGALYWTGIGRLVYGLSERRLLEFTGDAAENPTFALPCRAALARGQREVEVLGPLLEDEAALAHQGLWRGPAPPGPNGPPDRGPGRGRAERGAPGAERRARRAPARAGRWPPRLSSVRAESPSGTGFPARRRRAPPRRATTSPGALRWMSP